ncbi:glycosyltransferase [Pyxidicoccus fallax]|uniref:Glycosyltransferase n=1 Tax=Pyxidicoccus fallax TaxID=394095 RepID=A0A848LE42_9BACT|nr:glycosyltransferase [Pyxidicoccus fallax]NMO17360.1 glycosyltransferase [Pyxidicoccus fallax]NPC81296.1 glycosyltransferase [Pyxidicoccus fallax]
MTAPSVALVIETENLRGTGSADVEVASLARLLRHLRDQTFGMNRLTEWVITHEGLTGGAVRTLEVAAGRSLTFVKVPEGTGYYGSKDRGFDATTAEVVAFGDSDCWPAPMWLERLVSRFAVPEVQVVAGRTVYRAGLLGEALTPVDFSYFPSPLGEGCVRNFYANNVAFRRDVFSRLRYGGPRGFHRGDCGVLGLRLFAARIPVHFAPGALTAHPLPDTLGGHVRKRLQRGADIVTLSPYLADSLAPRVLRPLARVPGLVPSAVLSSRLAVGLAALRGQPGARQVAMAAAMTGVSLLDAVGAAAFRRARSER